MQSSRHRIAALVAVAIGCGVPRFARADPAPVLPSPAPVPSASPAAGPSDPCLALSSLVSRPTTATSACAVKRGDLLVETGYTNQTTSGAGAGSSVTYPQANVRVGLGRNLEFDLDPPSIERLSASPTISGATDTSFGPKYEIGYTSRLLYGVNALFTANTGNAATSSNGDGILFNANAALTLSPAFGLFATVGYNAQSAGTPSAPARYHGIDPSLGVSASLPANFALALEGFGQTSTAPGLGGRYAFDAAVEYDTGSRVQLDLNYYDYLGIQNGAHPHAIGFGASYLIGS